MTSWHGASDLWWSAPSWGILSFSTTSLCLDKCCEHIEKLRVFAMKWGSAARRLLWTDLSLARGTLGKKVFKLHLRKNTGFLYWLYSSMKKQHFWFCYQPFKVHIFYLPHAPALFFFFLVNYRPPGKNLTFKLHRMSLALRSHLPTSGEQAHEGSCETNSAGTSPSQVICHKDFFTHAQNPFSIFLGSNWNHGKQLPNKLYCSFWWYHYHLNNIRWSPTC